VYARRQFCGDLEVYLPPEPLCNPRLREAATTLGASGESACAVNAHRNSFVRGAVNYMGVWPPVIALQEEITNRYMLLISETDW